MKLRCLGYGKLPRPKIRILDSLNAVIASFRVLIEQMKSELVTNKRLVPLLSHQNSHIDESEAYAGSELPAAVDAHVHL